jgi:subtilase family serine protease
MKRPFLLSLAVVTAFVLLVVAVSASAQDVTQPTTVSESAKKPPVHYPSAPGTLVIPKSSLPQTPPTGHKFAANTNVEIFVPHGLSPDALPPFAGYGYETPSSLGCVYGLITAVSGCSPENSALGNVSGGSKTIAIVDAYDDPSAYGDLSWFSIQFGIPLTSPSQFSVIWAETALSSCYGIGVPVDFTGGWEVEESLDIEWAHAMAPGATIYLVEACSNFDTDLQQAVLVASNLVRCGSTEINPSTGVLGTCPASSTGPGEVSMSWGGGEYIGENGTLCAVTNTTADDACFTTPNVVYFASSGDYPGVIYPSASPNVVAAGGLSNRRNASTFNFIQQAAWTYGGGGQSAIEARPSYQSSISSIVGSFRGTPDLSFDADPFTGVYVYDTFPVDGIFYYEWLIVGGTSVSSPSLAGIVNNASTRAAAFAASSNAELTKMYTNKAVTTDFTDITAGFCGFYMGFTAGTGWDFCTGIGADKGYAGK